MGREVARGGRSTEGEEERGKFFDNFTTQIKLESFKLYSYLLYQCYLIILHCFYNYVTVVITAVYKVDDVIVVANNVNATAAVTVIDVVVTVVL